MCIQWSFVQVLSLHLDITYQEMKDTRRFLSNR